MDEPEGSIFDPEFINVLSSELGIPAALIESLPYGGDWLFIVKLHAMIEASLNHLIMHALGDQRLSEIISGMDTGDRSKGKMAFIKALDLLPKEARQFLTIISKLRNKLVHDITQYDFTLAAWISAMPSAERQTLRESMSFVGPWFSDTPLASGELLDETPRTAVLLAGLAIITMASDFSMKKFLEVAGKEVARIEGLLASYEAGKRSSPKGQ